MKRVSLPEISDDSGFLAILDPDSYESYLKEEWEFEEIKGHFISQMNGKNLLIWRTGSEGNWNVRVTFEVTRAKGFREFTGTISSTRGRLCLTNYENLTMAAMYREKTFPFPQQSDLVISTPPGTYDVRVIQLFDPESNEQRPRSTLDFDIEITPTRGTSLVLSQIPWAEV